MHSYTLKYKGGDADKHAIDAIQYSDSLRGTSQLYLSVSHFCMHGEVLKSYKSAQMKCFISGEKEGSLEAAIIMAASLSQIPLLGDLYKAQLEWLMGKILSYIKDALTGRGNVEKLSNDIASACANSQELNHVLANGILAANESLAESNKDMAEIARKAQQLQETLTESLLDLVNANRSNMRKAACPVGKSCHEMTHFAETENEVILTEADTDAIRSKGELEVDDMKSYECSLISALNTVSGHCCITLKETGQVVTGKINDPTLQLANNIYSKSLNEKSDLIITAKAVIKDGNIHKLYISDAKQPLKH